MVIANQSGHSHQLSSIHHFGLDLWTYWFFSSSSSSMNPQNQLLFEPSNREANIPVAQRAKDLMEGSKTAKVFCQLSIVKHLVLLMKPSSSGMMKNQFTRASDHVQMSIACCGWLDCWFDGQQAWYATGLGHLASHRCPFANSFMCVMCWFPCRTGGTR